MKKLCPVIIGVAALTVASGCSFQHLARQQVMHTTLDIIEAYDRETNLEFARQALPASLKMLDGTVEADRDNPILLTAAARSYARYAWGFVELELEEASLDGDPQGAARASTQAIDLYRRALAYGNRALARFDPSFAQAASNSEGGSVPALDRIDASGAAALYWTAFARGNLLRLLPMQPGFPAEVTAVRLMMARVTQLDSGLLSGMAHAYLGALYASLPPMYGQDLMLAGKHFEASAQLIDSCYLPMQLAYVHFYLRQIIDPSEYHDRLQEIIDADADCSQSWALDNAASRQRARLYLEMNSR